MIYYTGMSLALLLNKKCLAESSSFDPFLNEKFRFYPNMEGENAAILNEEIIFLH